LEYYSLY